MIRPLHILAVFLPLACSKTPSTDAGARAPQSEESKDPLIGQPLPSLTLATHDGKSLELAKLSGHPVVLYFYPKDETPGCTKQACALRDSYKKLGEYNAVLVGISADSLESHAAFAKHHNLPFSLASDADGAIAKQFQVPTRLGMTARQTIVAGPDGRIVKVYRSVDVATHAAQILADLQALTPSPAASK